MIEFFSWDEETFLARTEGSAIRRIGYRRWLRNVAVALGNGPCNEEISIILKKRLDYPCEMVREHVDWALQQQVARCLDRAESNQDAAMRGRDSEYK
ncbi:MAG: hypothetical protein ACRERS_00975 [Methylococcales bacterium]